MLAVHNPLASLLLGFCAGLLAGRYLAASSSHLFALAIALLVLLAWRSWRGRGSMLLPPAIFVLLGMVAAAGIPDPARPPAGMRQLLRQRQATLLGSIATLPEEGPRITTICLQLEAFKAGSHWHSASGRLLLKVPHQGQQWAVGQRLIARVRLKPVHNFNNPGGFNYRQYLANRNLWARGSVSSGAGLVPLGRPQSALPRRLLNRLRTEARTFMHAWLPPRLAALYQVLLLGERYNLRPQVRELLYGSGVGHLLAISGLHLGMVAGFAFLLFHSGLRRIPAVAARWGARPGAALAAFFLAFAYALLTGMALPALRATVMLAVFTLALLIQRQKDLFNALLLAALLILVWYPHSLFTASFQLSFVAVAALLWVLPRLPTPGPFRPAASEQSKWRRRGLRFYQFVSASLIVSFFTAPVVLYHFHRLTPAGPIANLLAVPLVGFIVLPAGLLALCFLPCSATVAGFLITVGSLALRLVLFSAAKITSLSWATLWPGTPAPWQVVVSYFVLVLPFVRISCRWRVGLLAGGCLLLLGSCLLPARSRARQPFLQVTYLDVGQGSAAVLELPGSAAILVDGGGFYGSSFDVGRQVVAPYLWQRRIRHLEAMVLTHAHPDHFKGLRFIAAHFPVRQFWYNNLASRSPEFHQLLDCLARRRIACLGPDELGFSRQINGVDLEVLYPPAQLVAANRHSNITPRELNNLSLVLRLTYGEISFLFPGDLEKEGEYRLLALPGLLPVQVLLVPHHGSRTSSTLSLLARLRPRIAIYSVGFANRFHLPAGEICKRYRALGIRTYRTDRDGAVTICTDGHSLTVQTFMGGGNKRSKVGPAA